MSPAAPPGWRLSGWHAGLPVLSLAAGLLLLPPILFVPLDAARQGIFALGCLLLFLVVNRRPGRRASAFLAALSLAVTLRYLHWRLTETLEPETLLQGFFMIGLVLAEVYAGISLCLGYFQTLAPLDRKPVPLPEDPQTWPKVDVFIPTYNESMEVVKPTVLAALAMDWPEDRFNVYILDDGRRPEFRRFAEECGAGYIIRPDNKGAKAGNINHALAQTDGEFIAIFDCDHVPTRAFLQFTLGWLVRDAHLAMVQTPHYFYSPDPFERNLTAGRDVPNEGLMFYGLVQPGNDLWNGSFFCGSCAVIRRTALLEVGGVPHETVTEDCHCSLRMQRRGWHTAYLRMPLASGLATERLLIHIGQRMRWARGMIQILRVENPLTASGLSLAQRLCYFSSMFHFMFALPRVVFLTSPLAFLLLGQNVIAASPLAILAYAGPHIVHAVATGSRLAGGVRHSFWSEIYETVLALYLVPLTIMTLINPRKGKFNVTDKGGLLAEGYYDLRAVWPNLVLALLLLAGIGFGLHGALANPVDSLEFQAFLLNGIWALLCLVPVAAGLAVGRERRQVRSHSRLPVALPAALVLPDGRRFEGVTGDISLGGASLDVAGMDLPESGEAMVEIDLGHDRVAIPGRVRRASGASVHVNFAPRSLVDEGNLVRAVFGRADAWTAWDRHQGDRPLRSLWAVVASAGAAFVGQSQLWHLLRLRRAPVVAPRRPVSTPSPAATQERRTEVLRPRLSGNAARTAGGALLLLLTLTAGAQAQPGRAGAGQATAPQIIPPLALPPGAELPQPAATPAPPAARQVNVTLRQLGLGGPMQMRGISDLQGVQFGVRGDEVVTGARLVVSGATSPGLIAELSQIAITLNEEFIGAIQPDRARPAFGPIEFQVSPLFFSDLNRLNFRFSGRYTQECNDPLSGLLWATVSDLSSLHLTLERLVLPRDLARLPEPFFDPRQMRSALTLPVILPPEPGTETLRAAAIATSWFAMLADYRGAAFPVQATPPSQGHAILVATGPGTVAGLDLPRFQGPTLALLPNPNDPLGQILVIGGRTPAEASTAATGLALARAALSGESAMLEAVEAAPRQPYDAPRWLRPDRPVRFGELVEAEQLQAHGYAPGAVTIPVRTAPDLYLARARGVPVELRFRTPPGPVLDTAVSRLDVALSGSFLRSVPLRAAMPSWPWSEAARWFGYPGERERASASLPPYLLSGSNDLQLRFDMRPLNRGDCVAVPGDIHAAIDPDSTIDLSRAHRFTVLPNLALFASAGFPFTRMADLSGTAVVLPERPNPVEISAMLNLVGRLAAIVGHPATGLVVSGPSGLREAAERDLIVLGTLGRHAALASLLRDAAPVRLEGNRLALALPGPMQELREMFPGGAALSDERNRAAARLGGPAEGFGALIGFESPLRSGRSVVVVTGATPGGVEAMAAALRNPLQQPRVQGDLAVLAGGRVEGFRTGATYEHGALPFWLWPEYYFGHRPEVMLGILALACLLIAWPVHRSLRARAARRLRARTP
ncbi:UDP-forming cellulose synthase catalytic subunit [Siccirubricoccus sp. G192]|uniref:UDP-forming cellulose synthase catalytic subunit n=1 Tax=Siccirubricoccus sp. G192 TaxID=2849651 RepID=UPI001C2C68DC|nr:UDP-forming cellulose synthase catalytic subunit [Siccirubricoccus sp. G192]MBV1796703.1 UDP-forming cellulose synthase catalytic subunit [Siccirubricoccus sp. G192]